MPNEELLYIEDENRNRLYYRFTPAALLSNFTPLIVVLDEKEHAKERNFEYKMWNVLTPVNDCDDDSLAWLGTKDLFYVRDLLQELIKELAQEHECEDYTFVYGVGKSSYGAMLHALLCKANAVFVEESQMCLQLPSSHNVFFKEKDLSLFLNAIDTFPIFYLCDSSDDDIEVEQREYFVSQCEKYDVVVHQDFCPQIGEEKNDRLKQVLNMFEKM